MQNSPRHRRPLLDPHRLIIYSAVAWLSIMLAVVVLLVDSNSQDLMAWIADGSPVRRQYDRFVDDFGIDDTLMIAWEGCVTGDPRLAEFENRLCDPTESDGLIRSARSGSTVVNQMMNAGRTEQQAISRLRQIYFANDGKTTCLAVQLSQRGNENRRDVIVLIRKIARDIDGLNWDEVYLVGPGFVAVMMDYETNKSAMLAIPACILGALLTVLFVRQMRLAVPILFTSLLATVNGLGVMVLTGTKINGLLVLMPPFVMVLCLSGCVHLVSYFVDELADHDWETAVKRATKIAFVPCSLSAMTTSIALFSLCLSQIPAVRQFGFFTAVSLLMGLGFILIVLKAWLIEARPSNNEKRLARPPSQAAWFSFCWTSGWIRRLGLSIATVAILVLAMGVYQADAVLGPEAMFPSQNRVKRSERWFQQNIDGANSLQVLVTVDHSKASRPTDQLDAVWSVQQPIQHLKSSITTFSAINFFGPIPPKSNARNFVRRSALNSTLDRHSSLLESSSLATVTESGSIWQIRLGFDACTLPQYQQRIKQIQAQLERSTLHPAVTEVSMTGMRYVVAHSTNQLFNELLKSFCLAFVFITPVMMVVLRGFWPGLISMLPNLAPTLIVFGGMGLLSIPISIGAILTSTVGLGIAVDDTLHFLCRYRESKGSSQVSQNSNRVIAMTVGKCLRPMVQTSVICGASLACFAFASFIPVKQFGVTITLLLLLALLCDLVLLPMILASPLGKVFDGRPT